MFWQAHNIKRLCAKVVQTTKDATPSLEDEASVIQEKYETLLTIFYQCHSKYNSSEAVEDPEIDVQGTTPTLYLNSNFRVA